MGENLNAIESLEKIWDFFNAVPEETRRELGSVTKEAKEGIKELCIIFDEQQRKLSELLSMVKVAARCRPIFTMINKHKLE